MTKGGTWSKHPKQYQPARGQYTQEELTHFRAEFITKNAYLDDVLERVTPYEYYRDMFPEGSFEAEGELDGERRPNGLASVLEDSSQPGRRYNRIIFDDLATVNALADKEFVVVPPIGYSGRRRLSKFAYSFYGICIDLDDVGMDNLIDLLFQMQNKLLPMATYIVNSGTGLHAVYLFDNPIPALPQYFESMGRLKEALSNMIWNQYTSREKNKQYQGIFQGYRMVGSQTKIGENYRVTAFRNGKKITLRYLNDFVGKEDQCSFDDISHTSLAEARECWNEWYQRRIVEKRPVGDYQLSDREKLRRRAWYEAWKNRMMKGAFDGNRHYCIGVLFNYAMKAEIPLEEALEDALALGPYLNDLTTKPNNEFTEADIYAAIKYYERKFIKMGRQGIKKMTKIDIGETTRRGRSQEVHLRRARAVQNEDYPDGSWRNKKGRPVGSGTAQAKVAAYRAEHPEATVTEVARELGISRTTVYKWWGSGCSAIKPT